MRSAWHQRPPRIHRISTVDPRMLPRHTRSAITPRTRATFLFPARHIPPITTAPMLPITSTIHTCPRWLGNRSSETCKHGEILGLRTPRSCRNKATLGLPRTSDLRTFTELACARRYTAASIREWIPLLWSVLLVPSYLSNGVGLSTLRYAL